MEHSNAHDDRNWFARHPIIGFLVFANGITITAACLGYMDLSWFPSQLKVPFTYLAKFGPSLGAIVMAALIGGRDSVAALLRPFKWWHVGARWYVLVVASPILLWFLCYGFGNIVGSDPGPLHWSALLWFVPLSLKRLFAGGGLGEEIGWRGFMLPLLQKSWGPYRATLVVGLVWGLWHAPAFMFAGTGKSGGIGMVALFTVYCTVLAFLFTFVYNRTGGSLLIAALFHGFLNGSNGTAEYLFPDFEGTMWFALSLLVVALPLIAFRKLLGRPPAVPIAS